MEDRVCPLVSGRNGLLVVCLGSGCDACRTAALVSGNGSIELCSVYGRPLVEGGK
jgi:hypothetical protein